MIRATRSRSSSTNHLRSQISSPKSVRPVDFSWFWCDFHSVAKQAPFRIAFRVDFGSGNGPKINQILSFGGLRSASAFRAEKSLISRGPQSWKSLVLLSKNKVFRETKLLPTGTIFGWFSTPKLLQNPLKVASKCCCFYDFVFEGNFNDFVVQFGALKQMKFWKNRWFMRAFEGTVFCMPFSFDFGAILRRPGTILEGFAAQDRSKPGDLL